MKQVFGLCDQDVLSYCAEAWCCLFAGYHHLERKRVQGSCSICQVVHLGLQTISAITNKTDIICLTFNTTKSKMLVVFKVLISLNKLVELTYVQHHLQTD